MMNMARIIVANNYARELATRWLEEDAERAVRARCSDLTVYGIAQELAENAKRRECATCNGSGRVPAIVKGLTCNCPDCRG